MTPQTEADRHLAAKRVETRVLGDRSLSVPLRTLQGRPPKRTLPRARTSIEHCARGSALRFRARDPFCPQYRRLCQMGAGRAGRSACDPRAMTRPKQGVSQNMSRTEQIYRALGTLQGFQNARQHRHRTSLVKLRNRRSGVRISPGAFENILLMVSFQSGFK
jgi:hypothetical protein